MVFLLSEHEKLLIIIFASCLFLLSLLITICVVSPVCIFHKWLFKSRKLNKHYVKQQILTQESKHFQLSVVPHYGSSSGSEINSGTKLNGKLDKINGTKSLTNSKSNDDAGEDKLQASKIKLITYLDEIQPENVKLKIEIKEIIGLKQKEYGTEPSCYICLEVVSCAPKLRRKSIKNKTVATFQTTTCKRCLFPVFDEVFITPEMPKNIIKEGHLNIKVFDEERYANDICLGETSLSLKQISKSDSRETQQLNLICPKEAKGEVLIEMCFLPTSNRVTFSIIKATVNDGGVLNTSTRAYYVRLLMFTNGKLIKKKKSTASTTLIWGDQEIVTFDLSSVKKDEIAFMIALAFKSESTIPATSSPSSPETPENELTSFTTKDKNVGHYIIGRDQWNELKKQPRKQIAKWIKLM